MIRNKLVCACVVGMAVAMSAPLAMAMKPADSASLPAPDAALQKAIDGNWRDRVYVQRDVYRHPGQTLAFFGIKPTQTVIEITPGGGWYSEILAPYLRLPLRASQRPMMVSDSPPRLPGTQPEYASAVSIRLKPASTKASSNTNEVASSALQPNTLPPNTIG